MRVGQWARLRKWRARGPGGWARLLPWPAASAGKSGGARKRSGGPGNGAIPTDWTLPPNFPPPFLARAQHARTTAPPRKGG